MTENQNIQQDYLKEKVRKFKLVEKNVALIKKRHEEELKPLEDLMEGLKRQIMGFLQQLGVRFVKTEYGDPGLYTQKHFSVQDQEAFKNHVITSEEWDLLVWAVRRTTAESYFVMHNTYPPGVHMEPEQKLRITAPTPLGKKRTKKTEVPEEEFKPFE